MCKRCHTVLIAPVRKAGLIIIALALATLILGVGAISFPFLQISRMGFSNDASLLDAAMAFSGPLMILSLAVAALIVLLPMLRASLTLYVLVPVVFDRPPARHAQWAFRWSEAMKPWSMAEIFVIGCAVALIKVADVAQIQFGAAFWTLIGLVLLIVLQDTFMCRWSVWKSLER